MMPCRLARSASLSFSVAVLRKESIMFRADSWPDAGTIAFVFATAPLNSAVGSRVFLRLAASSSASRALLACLGSVRAFDGPWELINRTAEAGELPALVPELISSRMAKQLSCRISRSSLEATSSGKGSDRVKKSKKAEPSVIAAHQEWAAAAPPRSAAGFPLPDGQQPPSLLPPPQRRCC